MAHKAHQFLVNTTGYSGISLTFSLDPSSASAPSEVQVQYTTDGTTWNNASSLSIGTASNGATDGISVATNSSVSTIVNGSYFQIANSADGLLWENGLTANFSGVSAANNDANFGVRIVNAATGTSEFEVTGTGAAPIAYPVAGAGNWRFDNVQINSTGGTLAAPTISTQPTNVTTAAGQPVTFTAAASGNPTPTVQWQVSTNGGSTWANDTTDAGNTTGTLSFTASTTAADNNNQYRAVFTNSQGSVTSNAATLSDALAAPTVTTQPAPVSTAAGNTATFTAAATGSPVPTIQWQSSPDNTTFTNITGATSGTYSFTTSLTSNNTYYRAVFTNSQGAVNSNSAKLTVSGTIIAAWSFPAVVAAPANSPAPTTGAGTASSLGMTNTYTYASTTATNSVTNDDITAVTGTAPATTEDVWRVRGHYVATGTAPNIGSPTNFANVNGWNLNAPQYTQGVEFDVSTLGYQTIQASFDWESTGSGVKNLQEQYNTNINNAGGWTNINAPLIAHPGNYILATPIDLSGIAGANNDANFGIRMVSVYDPNGAADGLTQVTDANGTHYPYASATSGAYNNSSGNWGFDNIQITGAQLPAAPIVTTQPTNQTTNAGSNATFTAAASGFPTPTVQWLLSTNGGTSFAPITGATSASYTVTSAAAAANGYEYEAVFTNNQGSATSNPATLTVTTAPQITTQPTSQSVAAGASVTLTAAASGNPTPTVQWQVSTNGGTSFTNIAGATAATYTFTATEALSGNLYRAVFTNTSGTATTSNATLTVAGTPITQWFFTSGLAPTAGGSTSQGTGNCALRFAVWHADRHRRNPRFGE